MISIRQINNADVTPAMVDVLYEDYLKKNVSARECALRLLNMHDGVKANEAYAHKEVSSDQIKAINSLFLIKGWSATCVIKKILQLLEDSRYGGADEAEPGEHQEVLDAIEACNTGEET